MPAWTAWNCWNGRVPARDRPHPKIDRPCSGPGARTGSPLAGPSPPRSKLACERKPVGCWMSPGGARAHRKGHPDWPDVDAADVEAFGLVSVLVTRQERSGRVRLCGWLVDVYCLGKRRGRPMRHGRTPAADFRSLFFAAYQARPIAAPLELAQQLVFGAVEYARALGSGQPAALRRPPTKLRSWAARAPSASGATASLLRPGSARQRRRRAADAGASVGRGNFTFLVQA